VRLQPAGSKAKAGQAALASFMWQMAKVYQANGIAKSKASVTEVRKWAAAMFCKVPWQCSLKWRSFF
jgi:hypothetical protein